jgi:regulator of sigma E protease
MVLGFLLVLGPLIVLHELGHYLVGRWFGVKADAFSVGFGKELCGWTDRRGTRWKLSALPLGGYVQFAGDMNPASQPSEEWLSLPAQERERTFQSKPLWQRSLIVAAGPLTNLLVAVAIFAAFNLAYGRIDTRPVVDKFSAQSAAQSAGVKLGDLITSVDGGAVATQQELVEQIALYPGRTVTLGIDRDGEKRAIKVRIASVVEKDRFGNESRVGRLGIYSTGGRVIPLSPVEAVALAGEQSWGMMRMMVTGVVQIATGERSAKELGGPIKIAKYSGEQLTLGPQAFVAFAALISINLAFINLLPIPALDGGHLAFYAVEAVRRKPLGAREQEWAFRTGIAFVLALMVFVTLNDVVSLFSFGS